MDINMDSKLDFMFLKCVLRRRRMAFFIPFISILFLAVVISLILPPIYRSETTIHIEEQQIPENYVKSTITSYADERIQMLTRSIMSHNKLNSIIKKFNLYSDIRGKYSTGELIRKIRKSINLETISANVTDRRTGRLNTATIAFTLSFKGKDPFKVKRITETLASFYLEEDLSTKRRLSSGTIAFLKEELENRKTQIILLENKISEFKREHLGELPEHNEINVQAISRYERQLDQMNAKIESIREKKIYLEGQIANVDPLTDITTEDGKKFKNPKDYLKYLRLQLIQIKSTLSEKHPDIKKLRKEIKELEKQVGVSDYSIAKIRRIEQINIQLAALKGKMEPKHPDVISLTKEKEMLSKDLDRSITEKTYIDITEEKPDNPTYINLMIQIATQDIGLKSIIKERHRVNEKFEEYQRKMERAPIVEKEYFDLTRDYKGAKSKYDQLMNKLMEAEIAKGMEETKRGERFTITEHAYLSEKPYKPNRLAIVLLGFVLAFSAGSGLTAVNEYMDHSIKSADDLNSITGIPVLSIISFIESDHEKRIRKLKKSLWLLGPISAICASLIVINKYVIPLDVLLNKIQQKIGIMMALA